MLRFSGLNSHSVRNVNIVSVVSCNAINSSSGVCMSVCGTLLLGSSAISIELSRRLKRRLGTWGRREVSGHFLLTTGNRETPKTTLLC
jgi:hypothetical protein